MIWLDAHLSPRVSKWINDEKGIPCKALRDIGLRDSSDEIIFDLAKKENVIIITKDQDFSELVKRLGSPPKVIWLRCGNTSEEKLKEILSNHLKEAYGVLSNSSEELIEIRGSE